MSLKPGTIAPPAAPAVAPPVKVEEPTPEVAFGIVKSGKDYLVVAVTASGSKVLYRDDFRMGAEDELARLAIRYWYDAAGVAAAGAK